MSKHQAPAEIPWLTSIENIRVMPLGEYQRIGDHNAFGSYITRWALLCGLTIVNRSWYPMEGDIKAFGHDLREAGWFLINTLAEGEVDQIWIGKAGVLDISISKLGDASINTYVFEEHYPEVRDIVERHFKSAYKEDESGSVHMLSIQAGMMQFTRCPSLGSPFVRENYSPQVGQQYDLLLKGLAEESPPGRLVILDGPPGTGKTHFVRALARDLRKQCSFVLIPPYLAAKIAAPEFIPALQMHASKMQCPIVLIFEDADALLVKRMGDNIDIISTLLNMADGIFGQAFDLRLIATTNAQKLEFDQAVLRRGRLLARVGIYNLLNQEANNALLHLVPGTDFRFTSATTPLADVYDKARELGWIPPALPKRSTSIAQPALGD